MEYETLRAKQDIKAFVGIKSAYHPLVSAIFASHNVSNPLVITETGEEHAASTLKNAKKASDRIRKAVDEGQKIFIYGDYDADGMSSTALMYDALRYLGASEVIPFIPSRSRDGYGISVDNAKRHIPDNTGLVIALDNGIKSIGVGEYLLSKEIDYIVIDHHDVDENMLPHKAFAIVNPKQSDCQYPNEDLAGVGVTYKVISLLLDKNDARMYLPLVAIGTIADVMSVRNIENRYFIREGLRILYENENQYRSIVALGHKIGKEYNRSETVAFYLAPYLNACGRMGHSSLGFRFLINDGDPHLLANEVFKLNKRRKRVQRETVERANQNSRVGNSVVFAEIEGDNLGGISGLVASRLSDKHLLPAVVINASEGTISGSIRSYGYVHTENIFKAVRSHLDSYGGHAGAGGFKVKEGHKEDFVTKLLNANLDIERTKEYVGDIEIGMLATINDGFYDIMLSLEPYSSDFRKPIFITKDVMIKDQQLIGQGNHVKMVVVDANGVSRTALAFNYSRFLPPKVDIAYTVGKGYREGEYNLILEGFASKNYVEESRNILANSRRKRI